MVVRNNCHLSVLAHSQKTYPLPAFETSLALGKTGHENKEIK